MTKTSCKCGEQAVRLTHGRNVGNTRHTVEECGPVRLVMHRAKQRAEALAKAGEAVRLVAVPRFDVVCESAAIKGTCVRGPDDVLPMLEAILPHDREAFAVVLLNARHEATGYHIVSVGSLNASIVHPREVFKVAILANAASVVLAHNHPSGDPEPSEEDMSITRRLVEVGDLVGIGVLDHIVVGSPGKCVSFRSRSLL